MESKHNSRYQKARHFTFADALTYRACRVVFIIYLHSNASCMVDIGGIKQGNKHGSPSTFNSLTEPNFCTLFCDYYYPHYHALYDQ
jgi:hypothetical protein